VNDIHWQHNQSIVENFDRETNQRDLLSATLRVMADRFISTVGKLHLRTINQKQAFELVKKWHRHHKPPQGWKFGVALQDDIGVLGVTTVGRPVSRNLDDGTTFEITRLAMMDKGIKNGASMLLGAACRAAKATGAERIISYTLDEEDGVSYKAAGFHVDHITKGQSWDRDSREREDKHPTCDKKRWVKQL